MPGAAPIRRIGVQKTHKQRPYENHGPLHRQNFFLGSKVREPLVVDAPLLHVLTSAFVGALLAAPVVLFVPP